MAQNTSWKMVRACSSIIELGCYASLHEERHCTCNKICAWPMHSAEFWLLLVWISAWSLSKPQSQLHEVSQAEISAFVGTNCHSPIAESTTELYCWSTYIPYAAIRLDSASARSSSSLHMSGICLLSKVLLRAARFLDVMGDEPRWSHRSMHARNDNANKFAC